MRVRIDHRLTTCVDFLVRNYVVFYQYKFGFHADEDTKMTNVRRFGNRFMVYDMNGVAQYKPDTCSKRLR